MTSIIRRSPYLAPTSTPRPKPHFQGHQLSLCSFPVVTGCPHLTHLRNINRIDSCPFQRTLLFWFPLLAFTPHHSLPPPLASHLWILEDLHFPRFNPGLSFPVALFTQFIFPWLPNIFVQPKSVLCVPNTTTYLTFPLGWLTGISNLTYPNLTLNFGLSHFHDQYLCAHNPQGCSAFLLHCHFPKHSFNPEES